MSSDAVTAFLAHRHDRVLLELVVDWQSRVARVVFSDALLVCEGLVSLVASRQEPWGPSTHVLDALATTTAENRVRVVFHMQSGDDVILEARSLRLAPCGGI